jgi:Bacterial regulatory helix-turn-helix protein, lysR family
MMDIDLNLLRIFDILYDERNVTRAAARLFLTQSAYHWPTDKECSDEPACQQE